MLTKPDKVKLHTLLGSYPNVVALKDGRVKSDLVEFDFPDFPVPNKGFKPLVREHRFDVGELAIACDSAEAVYRAALTALGLDDRIKDVHASALRTILEMQPLPDSRPKAKPSVAMDAAGAKSFAERFPDASRIKLS